MINNVEKAVVGDKVFFYPKYAPFPFVKTVSRVTQNFVFVEFQNAVGTNVESKFRRDGSDLDDRFGGRLATIEPGDIEKIEIEKHNKARITEIINLLASKHFKFTGYPQWYTIEQWEKLAAAVG